MSAKLGAHNVFAQEPRTFDDRAIPSSGSVKLLADLDGKILGGHILGANAGDLIAPLVYAMRFGLTARMIAEAMLPYPTMAEAVRWAAAQLQPR